MAQDTDNTDILRWHIDPTGSELMYEPPFPDLMTTSQHLHPWAERWQVEGRVLVV